MKPIENGGLVLESPDEKSLALSTLTAALVALDPSINSVQTDEQFDELATKIDASMEPEQLEQDLPINGSEKATLRDAVRAAELNFYFALGVITCFGEQNGIAPEDAFVLAGQTRSNLLQSAYEAAISGKKSLEFAALITLYGEE